MIELNIVFKKTRQLIDDWLDENNSIEEENVAVKIIKTNPR